MEVKRSGALTARGADKLREPRSPAAHSAGGGRGEAAQGSAGRSQRPPYSARAQGVTPVTRKLFATSPAFAKAER